MRLLPLSLVALSLPNLVAAPRILKTLDVSPVWSGHSVGFAFLTQHNQQFSGENERLQQDNEALRHRLAETEDDLAGTRTALRRLMHQANLTDPAG